MVNNVHLQNSGHNMLNIKSFLIPNKFAEKEMKCAMLSSVIGTYPFKLLHNLLTRRQVHAELCSQNVNRSLQSKDF